MSEVLFKCKIFGRAKSKKNNKQIFRTKAGKPFITSSKDFKGWAVYASCHMIRSKKVETIDYPINVSVKMYYSNKKHQQDVDNVLASVFDVLQDCAIIKNDNLIYSVDGTRKIYDSESEYIEIEITPILKQDV